MIQPAMAMARQAAPIARAILLGEGLVWMIGDRIMARRLPQVSLMLHRINAAWLAVENVLELSGKHLRLTQGFVSDVCEA